MAPGGNLSLSQSRWPAGAGARGASAAAAAAAATVTFNLKLPPRLPRTVTVAAGGGCGNAQPSRVSLPRGPGPDRAWPSA